LDANWTISTFRAGKTEEGGKDAAHLAELSISSRISAAPRRRYEESRMRREEVRQWDMGMDQYL